MFAGNITISDFFTVFNFLVLVAGGIYLFRRYFLDSIKAEIVAQENYVQGLKQQKEDLRGHLRFLDRSLQEQEQLAADIKGKIQHWHDAHERALNAQRVELEHLKLRIQKKVEMQSHYVELARVSRIVMPDVIQNAQQALKKEFESNEAGQGYIAHILTSLERGKYE